MRNHHPVEDLARDTRFVRVPIIERATDPRVRPNKPAFDDVEMPDRVRSTMHGIMMGEIQALEAAGRTTWDFRDDPDTPYELRLDMARQCWDEARHVEISIKLMDHMGTEAGEYAELTFLYEAGANPDPLLRLTGVNRALEGLAIDVFNRMRDLAARTDDPVFAQAEDFMLADEVTHVKMGSDWLRRLTTDDPERRRRALEFQATVDKLFSFQGGRGDGEQAVLRLARDFRRRAGFSDAEIERVAGITEDDAVEAFEASS